MSKLSQITRKIHQITDTVTDAIENVSKIVVSDSVTPKLESSVNSVTPMVINSTKDLTTWIMSMQPSASRNTALLLQSQMQVVNYVNSPALSGMMIDNIIVSLYKSVEMTDSDEEKKLLQEAFASLLQGVVFVSEARLHYEIAKAFYERKLTKFHNTDGFRNLLYYDFSGIIILMLTLLGCSSVFIKEKETEMIVLLKTSAGGKTETFMAKMMACILFLSSICILYSVEDYLLFTVGFGKMDAYLDPIYMLDSFKDSLLNINLLSFYGVCVVSRIIGSITIGMLFVIGSLYGKNSLQVILINFGILIGIVGLFHLFSNISRFINPLMLFFGRKLFMKQNFVNICGYPIWESVIVYSCSIFFCVIEVLWMKKRWERG